MRKFQTEEARMGKVPSGSHYSALLVTRLRTVASKHAGHLTGSCNRIIYVTSMSLRLCPGSIRFERT